ncbi:hypothetical protein PGT21_001794 [Puccinia graminis f. sp. tritici]|uniref:Uncharacterized protein n=1 Tax=Puccinia graminis f. sp. tritici TaxID=56615 RepID=A0A5B0Q4K4_PUCGR|nr:hypothetical protein PGT21_001794 [Puccinia graminis f. sp. tritici]
MALAPDPMDNSGYIGRFEAATGAEFPSHRAKRVRYEDPVFFPSDGPTTTAIHLQQPDSEWTPVNRQEQDQTLSHGITRRSSPPGETSGRPKRARDESQEIGPSVVGKQDKLTSRPFGSFSEQAFEKIMKAHNSRSFPYLKLADISPASVQLDSSIRLGQPIMGDYSQEINAYTGRYEVLIEDILETAHKLPNAYVGRKTRGWPATVVRPRHAEIEGEIILVLPTKDGDWRDAKSLVKQFKSLHRWIVYVHHLLLKNNNNPTSSSLQASYHQEMLLWLFGEVFNPKVGLPVIGRLDQASSNRQVFGPPQRWIMEFLVDKKTACTVSLALLGIWYLNAKSEEWQKEFRTDENFWSRMTTLINNDAKAGTEATGIHLRLKKRKKYEVKRNSNNMTVKIHKSD